MLEYWEPCRYCEGEEGEVTDEDEWVPCWYCDGTGGWTVEVGE